MFKPKYIITPKIASELIKIESLAQDIRHLPITPKVLEHLRQTARLESIHYSTKIEGNRLTLDQVAEVLSSKKIPGRERDEKEVNGYFQALNAVKDWVARQEPITVTLLQQLHAYVMGGGRENVTPTPYRDGQNVIREGSTGAIVYLPPEASDVPELMSDLVDWILASKLKMVPTPVCAAIAHYQFATIHPYYDGNGRTARLLATMIMHEGGYDLKGIYSLDEYYASDLPSYYNALDIGSSHNYYMGRADEDITSWIDYFCSGVGYSFDKIKRQAVQAQKRGEKDVSEELQQLDERQRKVVSYFHKRETLTANDVAKVLKVSQRTARALCQAWVQEEFLMIINPAKKTRTYAIKKSNKISL